MRASGAFLSLVAVSIFNLSEFNVPSNVIRRQSAGAADDTATVVVVGVVVASEADGTMITQPFSSTVLVLTGGLPSATMSTPEPAGAETVVVVVVAPVVVSEPGTVGTELVVAVVDVVVVIPESVVVPVVVPDVVPLTVVPDVVPDEVVVLPGAGVVSAADCGADP